jgi:Ca2+/Na+ antiporter
VIDVLNSFFEEPTSFYWDRSLSEEGPIMESLFFILFFFFLLFYYFFFFLLIFIIFFLLYYYFSVGNGGEKRKEGDVTEVGFDSDDSSDD